MGLFRLPDKRPAPGELTVIVVVLSSTLIMLGAIALLVALQAPPGKATLAAALIHYGGWSLGIGVFVAFAYFIVRRIT